jgi:hypothetical protein
LPGVSSPPESGPTLDATKTDNPREVMLSAAGLPGGAEVTITSGSNRPSGTDLKMRNYL